MSAQVLVDDNLGVYLWGKFLNELSENIYILRFAMFSSCLPVASCPQARRVGLARHWRMSRSCLETLLGSSFYLEVLEDFGEVFRTLKDCKRAFLYLFLSRTLH